MYSGDMAQIWRWDIVHTTHCLSLSITQSFSLLRYLKALGLYSVGTWLRYGERDIVHTTHCLSLSLIQSISLLRFESSVAVYIYVLWGHLLALGYVRTHIQCTHNVYPQSNNPISHWDLRELCCTLRTYPRYYIMGRHTTTLPLRTYLLEHIQDII